MGGTSVLCWKAVGRGLSSVAITSIIDREKEEAHDLSSYPELQLQGPNYLVEHIL